MKVIYLSMMFADVESDIKNSKSPNSVSGHKFQENILKGLEENDCSLSVINIPRIRYYPDYPKIIFRSKQSVWGRKTNGVNIGFVNLPILNYLSQTINGYRAVMREMKKDKNEQYVLFTFNSNPHTIFTMLMTRALHKNVTLCNIVGDLHGSYGITNRSSGLRGVLIRWFESIQDRLGRKFDSFVFLTEPMAEAMGVEHKPYCVMECLYAFDQVNMQPMSEKEIEEKIIFYAGSLCKEYGILHLLQAFSQIKNPSFRLRIAGKGDGDELVRQFAEKDERISFLGFISPSEVEKNQQAATVLVNPRTSDHEFVKYSFPSKTMECLASGKPYIAHRLPCNPPEYGNHIQYAAGESDEALRDKIVEICELSDSERAAIGKNAQRFIAEEKNPKVMCKRVVDLWSSL